MLVKDLRKTLEKYDKKEMCDIIVELFKRLPKKLKKIMILINLQKILIIKLKKKRRKLVLMIYVAK